LELVLVAHGKVSRAVEVFGCAMDFKLDSGEGVFQPLLDQRDCKMGDVYTDPLTAKFLSSVGACPAAAEWVENYIALS
jgi:hypothetical protein